MYAVTVFSGCPVLMLKSIIVLLDGSMLVEMWSVLISGEVLFISVSLSLDSIMGEFAAFDSISGSSLGNVSMFSVSVMFPGEVLEIPFFFVVVFDVEFSGL